MQPSVFTEVLLPVALALIMFGMGLTLTIEDFRRVVVLPKATAIGLIAQILLLPLLGFMIIQVIPMEFGIAAGLMILALSPGGPTASLITFLARGDAALSVTLTATSSLITLISTPIGLLLTFQHLGVESQRIQLPVGQTIAFLFVITIIPTALGMILKARRPERAQALETPFKLFGMVFLVLIIAAALLRERDNLAGYFAQAGIAALALNVVALTVGAGLALAFRLSKAQATCIAIDTGNCNGTLAIAIAATILRQPDMAITPAVYSLIMLILGAVAIFTVPKIGRRILKTESLNSQSVGDLVRKATDKYGPNVALLIPSREGFQPLTYTELNERVRRYAALFHELGLQRGDRIAIFAENSANWGMADLGAQSVGIVTVPIFPTLPKDAVQYILEHSEAKWCFCGSREQMTRAEGVPGISLMRLEGPDSLAERALKTEPMSRDDWNKAIDAVQKPDLSTLIYTSGTTGIPKGVMLPHRVFTHVIDGSREVLPFDRKEVFLSFLPMSHIYERVAGQMLPLSVGATIAYSRGLVALSQEMQDVKPSVMICVPRFLEATMDRILDNGKKLPWLDRKLFFAALDQGKRRANGQFAPWAAILDMLVLANVRDRLGGNFRYFTSGGAALPKHVAEFYLSLGINILQGYGLTETGGASFVNRPKRNRYWTVGEPINVEVKIAEDGEICLRGPGIMDGYYKNPEATAEALDADGWFHTGDIGAWEGDHLKITDRKKDLFKLSNGKYVAPQQIENLLKGSPIIQEAVIFGEGQDIVTALIIPNWEVLKPQLGAETVSESELVDREDVRLAIKGAIEGVNKQLAPHEIVRRFSLLERSFTIESGELTPTLKVKRRTVKERYEDKLAQMVH